MKHAALLGLAIAVACAAGVSAHERKTAGPLMLVIGWGDEPAYAGFKNAVEIDVSDAAGPVVDAEGRLSVDVAFGDTRVTLPLRAVGRTPGKFRAWLSPTRAGTYSFHITGTLKGQSIDVLSTCSDKTFACVGDVASIQFPAKDPSTGQLAERLERETSRSASAANGARALAAVAFVLAIAALVATLRRRRADGRNA